MRHFKCLASLYKNISSIRYSQSTMNQKVAVCQMTSIGDKAANLNTVTTLVGEAAKDGAQMLFFPEACDYLCDNKKDSIAWAEPILDSPTVKAYQTLASQHKVWLSMGGIHEKDTETPGKIYNTHVIINSEGDIVQTYRKLHLFDVEIPEKNVRLMESDYTVAGKHIVAPVESPVGKIGLAICYDMRFPDLSTGLSVFGAEIILYPSAFTQSTGEAHWHILLRARAIENQTYIIAAAQAGQHNSKRRSYGHGLIVSPWGEVLADCGAVESPCYKIAEISRDRLRQVRTNMPVFRHRRADVYSLYCLSLRRSLLDAHNRTKEPQETTSSPADEVSDRPHFEFGHVRVPETCVFFKSELTYAFVNLRCVIPGHVLVAPIRLVERNHDLTDAESDDFYRTIRLVQRLMERVHKCESCTITIQDGADAGRTVKHLHCHIMPRKKGDFIDNDLIYLELAKHDQLQSGHPKKPARTLAEMEAEAESLRNSLEKTLREER